MISSLRSKSMLYLVELSYDYRYNNCHMSNFVILIEYLV
jgi:hypothetical protein